MAEEKEQNVNLEDMQSVDAEVSSIDDNTVFSTSEYAEPEFEENINQKKFSVPKNQKAISRQRRNKIIGKVFACFFALVFLGIIVGTTALTYSTADRIWWENIGEEAGVEFKELFTLFNGVADSNEEKIVTKGFNEDDLNNFYTNLKRKMFLAQDYDLSVSKIITSLMSSTPMEDTPNNESLAYATIGVDGYDLQYVYYNTEGDVIISDEKPAPDEIGEPSDDKEGNTSLTGNEELDKLLQELKFDFSYLEQYNGEKNILEISDKQLGAVVNDAFSALSESFDQLKELENKIGKALDEVLAVKQIVISGNELDNSQTKLKLTLEVKVKDLVSNILKQNGIPSIVNLILPDKLYASATVYPYDATKPIEASVNRLEEEKVNKIVRIVDVILKKTGNATSISDMLVQVNGKVVEVLNQAQQKLPITFVPTGSVDLYPIESLMGVLDVDVSEQAFLYMMKDIKLPTGESLGLIMPTPEQIRQETNLFVSELSTKYCLDNNIANISADNTIKDVMNFASSENALDAVLLNDKKNTEIYKDSYGQQLKVRTSYDALAGMMSDYVNNEGLLGDIIADIVEMSYAYSNEMLSIEIRINLSEMLGYDDDSVMSSLIKQLVPEYIYVTANICVNSNSNIPTTIEINKTGEDNSKTHLQTLTALADRFGMDTSSLTYEGICSQIDSGLQSGLAQMQEQIGCEIIFTEDCAYLPNLFEVVCGTGLLDEDEEHKIAPQNLFNVMKQVYTFDLESSDVNRRENLNEFTEELESKYYLLQGKIDDLIAQNGDVNFLQSVMGLSKTYGTAIDKDALAKDRRDLSEIYPIMTAGEFAYVMQLNLDMDNISDVIKSADVLGARIDTLEINLYLQAQLYEKQDEAQSQSNINEEESEAGKTDLSKYSNLLPERAFVILTIDVEKMKAGDGTCVKMTIDGMNDESMSDFFSIVRKLTGNTVTSNEIESEIDAQFKDYMSGVQGIDYKFADGALIIDNLFNVIASSDMVKSDEEGARVFTPEEIRSLMQKLYGYDYQAIGGDFTVATNLDNFIDNELYNKYFISNDFKGILKGYADKDTLLDGFTLDLKGDNFVDNIRVKDLTSLNNVTDIEDKSQSQIDEEILQKFKPLFSKEEIAHILRKQALVAGDMSFMKEQEVVFADNDENIMVLTLRSKGNLQDENAMGLMPEYFYVNVTIDLGYIDKDGLRTDMNVYALDVNSMSYEERKEGEQDLELLMMFIKRIQRNTQGDSGEVTEETTLDGIMQDIEEKLKEFKSQIHNDVFTVTFMEDGGFVLNETLYQIALNSVYDVKANDKTTQVVDMPEEIDFRNGLCKVNNMPDNYEYMQGVFLDFKDGNRAANSSKAISEINDKYALANPLQEGELAILTVLGNYAKDYATNIDGEKLTSKEHREMQIQDLRPSIVGEELIWLLEGSVSFEADGYKGAIMNALYIRDDKMIIVYKSPVNIEDEGGKYQQLLPDVMSIVVNIDLNVIDQSDVVCTQIAINNLLSKEVDAIQSMLSKLNEKSDVNGESENKSMAEANKECSDSVRSTMKSLTDNMRVAYKAGETIGGVTAGGTMVLDSIYEVASQKINSYDTRGEEPVNPQEVKETLEALFDGLHIDAYNPPADLNADDMKIHYTMDSTQEKSTNLFLSPNVVERKITLSGAIGGWNIASMINTNDLLGPLGLDKTASQNGEVLKLKHTALIPTRSNGDGTFEAIREELKSLGDREYFLITLDMDMVSAAGMKMSILPERMDLTLYMDLTDEKIFIIYNAMDDAQRQILSRLVKTSRPEGVGGLDLSNTDAVKAEIMDMEIINETYMGYTFTVTLGELLKSGGIVLPINTARQQVVRDDNIILGMGAMVIDYTMEL